MCVKKLFTLSIVIMLLQGCSSTIPIEKRESVRQDITASSEQLVMELTTFYPQLKSKIAQSEGYAVVDMSNINLSIIGGGTGIGAMYDNHTDSVTYFDVDRYNLAIGLGYNQYQALVIFDDRADMERFLSGEFEPIVSASWDFGVDTTMSSIAQASINENTPIYVMSRKGAIAIGGATVFKTTINHDLTDTGLGEGLVANKSLIEPDTDAREWSRALPFFAQDVIDKGFDLPKPYGISIVYTDTFQGMNIDELEVGFNGSDRLPIDFVTFHDNSNSTKSPQLKVDAWIFPFMNVFASVGKIKGEADIAFTIDGNGFLEQSGVDCSKIANFPICKALADKALTVPVVANLRGTSYTVGTILAAGWEDYFFVLPLSFTYADMKKTNAEGHIFSASPRIGKRFALSGLQSISVFAGAAYFDSDLILTGEQAIPGTDSFINYEVHQSNADKWSGVVGANYIFNHEWSVAMEYNWKSDDKRQFISSVTMRF
ncbi:lipid-binding SYLF domain-containing protein [Shewanella donghaensis]|uniref:hypothetical protein n=1 Tax=Shewanella donghaensis TaxID=238836 RepID=UPI0011835BD9|nr:hypothetical protein [Shewanella donghaensis]